jgi:hypothetical protein
LAGFLKEENMAKFLNNEPMFKVGDKVVYSRRRDDMSGWEKESISKGPLTISRVDKRYENNKLVDVTYFVEGLCYCYSEDWLSYAPAGPKFKIGDAVRLKTFGRPYCEVTDVITLTYASTGCREYAYKLKGEVLSYDEYNLEALSNDELLIHDLEICGGKNNCKGCSREDPDGGGIGCDKLELDAAELIKKLQKRVKELEEKK